MEKEKIERINYLARKSKSEGLSEVERAEQKQLRDEYRAEIRKMFEVELQSIEFTDGSGGEAS